MSRHYSQNLDSCFAQPIGQAGIAPDRWSSLTDKLPAVRQRILQEWKSGHLPLLSVPTDRSDLAAIESLAAHIRQHAKRLIVLGTGGSSLGAKMLVTIAREEGKAGLPVQFVENVDPHTVEQLLAQDHHDSFFLLVSKSGSTLETLSVGLLCLERLKELKGEPALRQQSAILTMTSDSPLKQLADAHQIPLIEHPAEIGGRYSILTATGLIPALVAGMDIHALRQGAADTVSELESSDEAPPLLGAAMQAALMQQGARATVLMPYCDRLFEFGSWFRQLWAESLGKEGWGTVPVRSLGTVDQHSQLQLYLDGPNQLIFTLMTLRNYGQGIPLKLDLLPNPDSMGYAKGSTIGDLIASQQQGTAETLAARGRPVRLLEIPELTPQSLGALLMHFMLETIATAYLLEIDPFDQPAVEESKIRARAALKARKGV